MGAWRGRWYLLSSFILCTFAVVFGTLLYPVVLLFFSLIALVYPILRRESPGKPSSSSGAPPEKRGV
jgi:hypothetical protein